jgi:short-subunit dehydrogenase
VTLVARRRERLEELARELGGQHGVRAEVIACDLGEPRERGALQEEIDGLGLTVEVLCNNAGFGTAGRFVGLAPEREAEIVRLNCEAVVDLCARYAAGMVERARGAIMNVASTAAFQPLPRQATYAASKAFVLSFSEALHQELSGDGITVTALCPGPVRTEFAEVAGIAKLESATPGFLWAGSDSVAEAGVRGLEHGRRVVIPGAVNRLGAMTGTHAPRALFLRAAARFYPAGRD